MKNLIATVIAVSALSACTTTGNVERDALGGAALGALGGAAIGEIVGGDAGDGAIVGGIVGGVAGAQHGHQRDVNQQGATIIE